MMGHPVWIPCGKRSKRNSSIALLLFLDWTPETVDILGLSCILFSLPYHLSNSFTNAVAGEHDDLLSSIQSQPL